MQADAAQMIGRWHLHSGGSYRLERSADGRWRAVTFVDGKEDVGPWRKGRAGAVAWAKRDIENRGAA